MKILVVRLSSMGDIVHTFPAISDVYRFCPNVCVDWLVEESFAELPRLHCAVSQTILTALRRWRGQLGTLTAYREMYRLIAKLRRCHYDCIIDPQGLIKSAGLACLTHGPLAGYDFKSARETLASCFYTHRYRVEYTMHAISRARTLFSQALAYPLVEAPQYGITLTASVPAWVKVASPYVVLLTASSQKKKEWPESSWLFLGQRFSKQGLACIFPWGNYTEWLRARRLAKQIPGAVALSQQTLSDLAVILAKARLVVGVDTGLLHLATAVGTPAVGLFFASDPRRAGLLTNNNRRAMNLGHPGVVPSPSFVWEALESWC